MWAISTMGHTNLPISAEGHHRLSSVSKSLLQFLPHEYRVILLIIGVLFIFSQKIHPTAVTSHDWRAGRYKNLLQSPLGPKIDKLAGIHAPPLYAFDWKVQANFFFLHNRNSE